jgi:hypothetical protein
LAQVGAISWRFSRAFSIGRRKCAVNWVSDIDLSRKAFAD